MRATLPVFLALVAVCAPIRSRAGEPFPNPSIEAFTAERGVPQACPNMTAKALRDIRRRTTFKSEMPRGCHFASEPVCVADGILATPITDRPETWAVDYTWFWVREGMPPGVYRLERMMQIADSLALPDSAELEVHFVVLRREVHAVDWKDAGDRAAAAWPAEMPPDLLARFEKKRMQIEAKAAKREAKRST